MLHFDIITEMPPGVLLVIAVCLIGNQKEKPLGLKKSHSPSGIPNNHQECKGMQIYDQHFLHMGW